MSVELITLIMFGGLIVLLLLGVPIVWTMSGLTIIMTLWLWDFAGLLGFIAVTFGAITSIFFIALPLFIFMGVLLKYSAIADDLFETFYIWSGPLRGGIAIGTVVTCVIFAAMTGLSAAACITMGLIALPAMRERGYDKLLALGVVAGPSTLGILIPPSIVMIMLGIAGKVSVGSLFMAGIGPGLLMAFLSIMYIVIRGLIQPESCPAIKEKFKLTQKMASLRKVILPVCIVIGVLGSIFLGIATPTEAAAVGVAGILISIAIRGRLNRKTLWEPLTETFRVTALNMWIIFTAMAFASTYIALGGIDFVTGVLAGLELNRWGILIVIMLVIFVMGMFVDPAAIIWIVGPLGFPIIKTLGFDPIWFGVLFVINICIAYITPPFGVNLFYLRAIVPPDISMRDIFLSIWPFVGVMIVTLALVMIFPQISLWLPQLMYKLRG